MPEKNNNSLRVIVRKNPFDAPLLDSRETSTIEVRDADGNLALLVLTVPGHPVYIVSKADQEDFAQFVKNLGIPLQLKD